MNCPLLVDTDVVLYYHLNMTYTPHQLRSALIAEHAFFYHDDDSLMHPDDYRAHIAPMLLDELIAETDTDDTYDLQLYMQDWLPA